LKAGPRGLPHPHRL